MKKFSVLSCFLLVIGILTCVSCGYLFSNVLLSTNIFASSVCIEKQTVYALATTKAQTSEQLFSLQGDLQAQNGGGVIFEQNSQFYLLASAYQNLTDAQKVQANLKQTQPDCEIVTLQLPSIAIQGNFSTEEKEILT